MSSFLKQPTEIYSVAIEFVGKLPDNTSLLAGTLSALNLTDGSDATATVLDSATATISGTQAQMIVKAGTAGHTYKLTLRVTLTPGSPVPLLEEDLTMLVQDQ